MRRLWCLLLGAIPGLGCASSGKDLPPLSVVPRLELRRYTGTWYEIARLPFSRQEGCHATTATYRVRDDGKIAVTNRCRGGSFDGEERLAEGTAWVVDPATNAKLKVRFFWPFSGDYWVIELGEAADGPYSHAVVGMPSRKYLWILSRTPKMDEALYRAIVKRAAAQGFETGKLIRTPQR